MFSFARFFLLVFVCSFVAVSAYDPNLCQNCMGGMPMPKCPSPSACGYAPVNCTTCIPTQTPACKYPDYCSMYTCSSMCMNGMPMPGCPDPGVCGFKPIACTGCQVGNATATCPRPDWCTMPNGTMPSGMCNGCVDGKVTSGCPDPSQCGFAPACDNCMAGMAMPDCPNYDACLDTDACMMEMVFNVGHHTCVLLSSWNIRSGAQWFGTIVAIFAAAFLREFVSFYRSYAMSMRKRARDAQKYSLNNPDLQQSLLSASGASSSNDSPGAKPAAPSSRPSPIPYASDSFFYFIQHFLSYLLMLVIMTYNFYLFIAVVLSFAISHFLIHYGYAACWRSRVQKTNTARAEGKKATTNDVEQKTGGDHCCEDIDIDE